MSKTKERLPLGPCKSWSYTRLMDGEKCSWKIKLQVVDKEPRKEPEPDSPLVRGERVHKAAEDFVQGVRDDIAEELRHFETELFALQQHYRDGKVMIEDEWAYTRDMAPCDWRAPEAWIRLKLDVCYHVDMHTVVVIDYKGLPLSTPLPTPRGWTTMGEVQVGDTLFDRNGKPCTVTGKSGVKNLPNYRITFDDTSVAECDEEHLWTLHDGTVKVVTELSKDDLIATAESLQLPEVDLPIDPYVLGLWLADGKHTSGEITKPDDEVWQEVEKRGYEVSHDYSERAEDGKCRVQTVYGLRTQLRKIGLLGNKHIPPQYLRASYQQRLDLLRGIMDGDGSANHTRNQVVLNTTNRDFALQVQELLLTLGQRPLINEYVANGFGKTVIAWNVSFRPRNLQPFLLLRKAEKVERFVGPGEAWRITKVEQIATQPTQCIMVDSPDHTFLCTEKFIPTHNTGKKFGNEIKHAQQGQLYAGIVATRFPSVTKIIVEFWYTDQDDATQISYTRRQALIFLRSFLERAEKLTTMTHFVPKPNLHNCKFCDYGNNKGTGVCQFDVY